MVQHYGLTAALLVVLTLGGCSGGGGNQDLVRYMQEVRQRPAKPIDPIPAFEEYRSFTYSAAAGRSPFDLPVELVLSEIGLVGSRTDVKPDLARPKDPLEYFSISAITMVGTVNKADEMWALVNDGTGNIHRVRKGNYMGRNHGRIINIDNTQISLVEIVPDGVSGWIERPKVLKLVESSDR